MLLLDVLFLLVVEELRRVPCAFLRCMELSLNVSRSKSPTESPQVLSAAQSDPFVIEETSLCN